jgi:sugar transferase (PEP-CTERM/EpsH1 system associated)
MKLLLTLPRPLFPADTGGKIRTLNIFSRLARSMEIHAVSLADRDRDIDAIAQMRRVFQSYTPVFWTEIPTFSARFYMQFLRARAGRFPYFLAKYRVPELTATIERLLEREKFDLMLCDFLQSAVAMLGSRFRPRVLFEHNVEYVIRKRHWEQEKNPLRKALLNGEWQKARAVEGEVCRAFDHVVSVSPQDGQLLAQEFQIQHVSTLPTGVDADYFQPQDVQPCPGRLVFVGSMDWHPNEDGVLWFLEEIFPLVRQKAPHATLTVVGRNPSQRLRALAAGVSGVEITGTVPDVRPYIARAEVVVVPLRIGGGTRIKIFEAMAMGRPVVSTALGAEGLPVRPQRDIVLGNDPLGFAEAAVALINDGTQRERIGAAGRELVIRNHTWDLAAQEMGTIVRGVAALAPVGCSGYSPRQRSELGAARQVL